MESELYDECAQRIEADLVGAEENHRQCLEAVEGIETRISAHGSWWLALARLRRPGSALQGARLVPNIYLPNEQAGSRVGALWSQIDCVIATRSCAFVVEVKLRHADIVASKAFENVFIKHKSSDGADKPALQDFGWALDQNAGHAVALSQHIREYPYEKIYEVLVVVGAKSFASADKRFRGNIFVGCVPNETDVLLRAIEQVVEREEEVLMQDELDALADEVIERYGDLNQQRAALHVRRLQNIHG